MKVLKLISWVIFGPLLIAHLIAESVFIVLKFIFSGLYENVILLSEGPWPWQAVKTCHEEIKTYKAWNKRDTIKRKK
jgi:membrane protein implicated in regulation of membrane protease activity